MKTIMEIEPAYETTLRAAGLADFDAVMNAKCGPAAGRHRHRETVPLELAVGGTLRKFFLKRVFWVPPKHAFWPLFRLRLGRSQPRQEWYVLDELRRAGIPAMRRVAFGERRRFGMPRRAFLLVEAVAAPHTLRDWLVPGFPKPQVVDRQVHHRLVHELGLLVGQLHGRGFAWPDLHAKHVFATPSGSRTNGRQWQFCLIDVERMRCRPPVRRREVHPQPKGQTRKWPRCELHRLMASLLPLRFDRSCLRRFLLGYARGLGERLPAPPSGEESSVLLHHCRRFLRSVQPEIGPRLADDYRHPACDVFEQQEGFVVDALARSLLAAAGLRRFGDFFTHAGDARLDKPGLQPHRQRLRIQVCDAQGSRSLFYLKRYCRPPLAEQFRRIVESKPLRSSAWREFHFINKLRRLGVATAHPVAFGEEMLGRWEVRSFVVTAEIQGQALEKLLEQVSCGTRPAPSWTERREIIEQLAAMTRTLHAAGLFHRDLYFSHVFLTHNRDGGGVLRLIDLARMIERPWLPGRWRIKDLAALDYSAPADLVTHADRLRFLYHYLGWTTGARARVAGGGSPGRRGRRWKDHARDIIRAVRARASRMARHDAKRGRGRVKVGA